MSSRATSVISREKAEQLLKAVGTGPAEDAEPVEATEHDWRACHYFSKEQLVKLDYFAQVAATAMARKFSKFSRSEFDVKVAAITQHYVSEFLGSHFARRPQNGVPLNQLSETEQKDYYIPFGSGDEQMYGLVGIPEHAAVGWAGQLLGDGDSEKRPGKELSQLEETLLSDLVAAVVEEFSGLNESFDFHTAKRIVKGQWPLDVRGSEELCKISFDVKRAGTEKGCETYFLILSRKLAPVAGKTAQDTAVFSEQDISKAVLGHLQKMPMQITGRLASAVLTFEEIMNLQVDDILLLDKRVDQPAELIVDGRTVYYGRPAKSDGRYAVAITGTTGAFGDTDENVN
jgi:flagellar motor switch protein FliM